MAEPTERIAILLELQQQQFEKKAKSAGAAIDRLERKFNPLAAAEAKLTKEQLRFNAALEAGTIDAAQHAKGMDLVQREYDQTIAKSKTLTSNVVAMNSAVAAQTGFMTRNRHVFQQAGYQVGDFAVQVQGGQSALVAFSQQGSQMLGVFGPWGAVMGAALAVGSSLAGVLLNLGDATEETKKKAKTFTDRVEEADAALAAMSGTAGDLTDLEGLRKKYGELTDEVQQMALALFEIDKRAAVEKVIGIITEVTGEIAKAAEATAGTVAAALAASGTDAARAEAAAYRQEIESIQAAIEARQGAGQFVSPEEIAILVEMREELAAIEGDFANIGALVDDINISPDLLSQISEAQSGLEAARDVGDFSAMADQLGTIRDLLIEVGDKVNQDVIDGVTKAEELTREFAARLEEGKDAAEGIASVDLAGGISPAVDEARKLAENFGIALSLARQLTANAAAASGAGRGRGGDPSDFGGSAGDIQKNNLAAQLAYQPGGTAGVPLPKVKGAKGGIGRKKKSRALAPLFSIAEGELEKLQRQIDMIGKSKGEIAALTTKHKLLDEAKKRGMSITEELTEKIDAEAAEVGDLAAKYDQARDKIAAMEQIQGQFKDSVIDAAMGGADAFDNFKDAIKRAAFEYALFGTGLFAGGSKTSGSGLLGGLLGGGTSGLLGGLLNIGSNANGTSNWRGGLTTVNERGGELMNLPDGTQIIPHDLSKRMVDGSGGGASSLNVTVTMDPSTGALGAFVTDRTGQVVARAIPNIVDQSVQATGKRMSQTSAFGRAP
ncbi:hypothetical protein [Sulfitobacter sp.]|uniref:hypothetical protein n=1 Tax=Sulfitobacter sp. TaxID=1903071 RepID=UPI003002CD82